MNSMYVDFRDDTVRRPAETIAAEDARGIIHTAEVAIQGIIEVTEIGGNQIGTKGFMK
jgi:hypothetical protein